MRRRSAVTNDAAGQRRRKRRCHWRRRSQQPGGRERRRIEAFADAEFRVIDGRRSSGVETPAADVSRNALQHLIPVANSFFQRQLGSGRGNRKWLRRRGRRRRRRSAGHKVVRRRRRWMFVRMLLLSLNRVIHGPRCIAGL